jgi:hypothetical protein
MKKILENYLYLLTDDPQKCKIKINKKIQDIDAKINKLKKEGYETFNVNL